MLLDKIRKKYYITFEDNGKIYKVHITKNAFIKSEAKVFRTNEEIKSEMYITTLKNLLWYWKSGIKDFKRILKPMVKMDTRIKEYGVTFKDNGKMYMVLVVKRAFKRTVSEVHNTSTTDEIKSEMHSSTF